MNATKIYKFLILLMLGLSTVLQAKNISLTDYLNSLYAYNPTLKRIYNHEREQEALVNQQFAQWDTHLFFNGTYGFGGVSFVGSFAPDVRNININAGQSKEINGSIHSLSIYHSQSLNPPAVETPSFSLTIPDILQIGLTYSYTKPLLKNYKGLLSDSQKNKLSTQKKLLQLSSKEDEEEFLLLCLNDYLNWVRLQKRVDVLKLEIEKAKNQYTITSALLKDKLVDKQDEYRAKKRLLFTERAYKNEKSNLDQQTKLIQEQIGIKEPISPDLNVYKSIESFSVSKEKVFSSLPFQVLEELEKDIQLDKRIAEEMQKKELNLKASLSTASFGNDTSSMIENLGSANSASIGISGQFSKQQTQSKSLIEKAEFASKRLANDKAILQQELSYNFDKLLLQRNLLADNITHQKEIIELSRSIEQLEANAYKRAQRSSLIIIIEAQRDLLQDQLQLIDFAIQKDLTHLALLQLSDDLLHKVKP
jgi:hypothetical protein